MKCPTPRRTQKHQNQANYNTMQAQMPRGTTERPNRANVDTTTHPVPRWSQKRQNRVNHDTTISVYLKTCLWTFCMLCVVMQDVRRSWAIWVLWEIGEFHIILPGNQRLIIHEAFSLLLAKVHLRWSRIPHRVANINVPVPLYPFACVHKTLCSSTWNTCNNDSLWVNKSKSRSSGPSQAQALAAQGSRLRLQFLQAQALKSRA